MEVLDEQSERGVTEIRFDTTSARRRVPAILWRPAEAPPRALVLTGHTVGQDKRAQIMLSIGRRFARHHNIATLSIDALGHGEREGATIGGTGWWTPTAIDDMILDWRHALAEVDQLPEFQELRIGYWGLSLGTWIGIPFAAAESRIESAVFGLAGYSAIWQRVADEAPRVRCPVQFYAQNHDELVRPQAAQELFDMLGSADKEIFFSDGDRYGVPPEYWDRAEQFLAGHLLGAAANDG